MKKVLFTSTCLVALTSFGGVLLSAAHSRTIEDWKQEHEVFAEVPSRHAHFVFREESAQELKVGDQKIPSTLRPRMRPDGHNMTQGRSSMAPGLRPQARPVGSNRQQKPPERSLALALPEADTMSVEQNTSSEWQLQDRAHAYSYAGHDSYLPDFFEAPSRPLLQAWLEDRPRYDLGTQVGVFR